MPKIANKHRNIYICKNVAMNSDIYVKTDRELVQELGRRFKEYRLHYNKTQREVAEFTGLSTYTINSFENGKGQGLSAVNLLKLLRSVGALEDIEKVLPPLPLSPMQLYELQGRKRKRASRQSNGFW